MGDVLGAGDVDGDGLDDLCAGSFGNSENGNAAGKSYVITGADMPSDGTRDLTDASYAFVGEAENDWSGLDIGPAGDMDRDGLPDLTIGAMGHSESGKEMAGRAYLFYAQNTEVGTHSLSDADHIFEGERAWDGAGYRTLSPGDMNGDGYADIVVGAYGEVHVMDWGVARVLSRAADAEPQQQRRERGNIQARSIETGTQRQ